MSLDIFQKIEKDFGKNAQEVHDTLNNLNTKTKGLISLRLIRAIIYLSDKDIEKFHHYVKLSQLDYRDVLYQAEYDYPSDRHLRDFDKTFYELGLLRIPNI